MRSAQRIQRYESHEEFKDTKCAKNTKIRKCEEIQRWKIYVFQNLSWVSPFWNSKDRIPKIKIVRQNTGVFWIYFTVLHILACMFRRGIRPSSTQSYVVGTPDEVHDSPCVTLFTYTLACVLQRGIRPWMCTIFCPTCLFTYEVCISTSVTLFIAMLFSNKQQEIEYHKLFFISS